MKIVVADDDPLARQIATRTLTRAGYEVLTAEDGLHALNLLTRKDGPRLALLDWTMPGLDGPEVCRQLRAQTDRPYVYAILLTSRESKEDLVTGLEAGADDYLTKPCNAEELKARLRAGTRILTLQDQLFHDARHDPLTQLPNRACFMKKLEECFQRSRSRHDYKFAVLFVDLDRFKTVNDTLGHAAGDELLVQVSQRIARAIRRDDAISRGADFNGPARGPNSVARMGGDEFTILLEEVPGEAQAGLVASRIRRELAVPFHVAGKDVTVSASIGIALSDMEAAAADDLLREADSAMYREKAPAPIRSGSLASARA